MIESQVGNPGAGRRPILNRSVVSTFLLLVLIVLVVVPILVQQRIERLHRSLDEIAQPARDKLFEIQYLLASQSAELRGYVLTPNDNMLLRYEELAESERLLYRDLEEDARRLGPEFLTEVVQLRTISEEWHNRVDPSQAGVDGNESLEDVLAGGIPARITEIGDRAHLALDRARESSRADIEDARRVGRYAYVLLSVLGIAGIIGVAGLNTQIGQLEAESDTRKADVRRAVEDAERMMSARSDLIRGFTHDVKNPLGAADGYAQLLEAGIKGELSVEQAATIRSIRNSIRGATEIIEQLLDLSRLERGGLRVERQKVPLDELVRSVVRGQLGAAANAGVELSVATAAGPDTDAVVYSDPSRIVQILDNLISNALKYTPAPGRAIVCVQAQSQEVPPKPGNWVAIAVSDSGPGIPAEEIERIFDEFHRVPGSLGRGHGLGLAISRRVARLLGGDVTVRSALGTGSTFLLWLPEREDDPTRDT